MGFMLSVGRARIDLPQVGRVLVNSDRMECQGTIDIKEIGALTVPREHWQLQPGTFPGGWSPHPSAENDYVSQVYLPKTGANSPCRWSPRCSRASQLHPRWVRSLDLPSLSPD